MKEIHEKVLSHLRETYPDLCFSLRKIDKGGRLRKGYWFLGNDGYLAVSFWQGQDWRNKTPNIFFIVHSNHATSFELVDRENSKKRVFFEKIAKPLKIKALKNRNNEPTNKWARAYSEPHTNYIEALDNFLQNEKELLDTLISLGECAKNFPPIDTATFQRDLIRIEKFRKKNESKALIKESTQKRYPLSIERIKLRNISHFDSLEIDLSQRVTCFIGENGSGKTTILRAIVFGLIGFSNDTFVREDIEKLEYELKNFLKIKKAANGQIEYAESGEIELFYNKNKKNSIKFRPLPEGIDDEGQLRGSNEIEIDDSDSDFDALDDSGNFKNLVISFSQIKSADNVENNEIEDTATSLREIYSLLYNAADVSFANIQDWIMKAFNANNSEIARQKAIKVLKKAFEIMSQITGENIALGDIEPQKRITPLVKTPDSPNGIPLNLVSQGYENLIGWVGYLVKRLAEVTPEGEDFTETPAICLIDEIDTYLHPKWQRNLLKVLIDTFKNVQFIVTTHSPQVVMNLHKENVIRIEKGKAYKNLFVEGRDANALSTDVFGLSKRLPEFEKILDDIHDLIDREEKEKAEEKINYLKQKWGDADIDLHRAETFIELI